jgi:hypothetical protein
MPEPEADPERDRRRRRMPTASPALAGSAGVANADRRHARSAGRTRASRPARRNSAHDRATRRNAPTPQRTPEPTR